MVAHGRPEFQLSERARNGYGKGDVNTSGQFRMNGVPLAKVAQSGNYADLAGAPAWTTGEETSMLRDTSSFRARPTSAGPKILVPL